MVSSRLGWSPPSTSGGITVSWFSIIYPHQVEKHNPDSPFNSLSLSCSPHIIVVLRTNMSYVCERWAANGRVLKSAHLHLQVRPVLRGDVVGALIPGRFFFFFLSSCVALGFLEMRHSVSIFFFYPLFNALKGRPAVPIILLLSTYTHLKHVLIRQVTRGVGLAGENGAANLCTFANNQETVLCQIIEDFL